MNKESRSFTRFDFSGPLRCQVRGSHEITRTVSEDLSLSGVKFINNKFIAPSTPIMLEISLKQNVIRPIARIVWSSALPRQDNFALGAEFIELDSQDKKNLSDYLKMRISQQ